MDESTIEMIEENNKMLKKLLKKGRWGNIFRFIKYTIILIIIIGAWYYIKPYVDKAAELYGRVNETTESINELKVKADNAFDLGNIFGN